MATKKHKAGALSGAAVKAAVEPRDSRQGEMEGRIADGIKSHRELLGLSANDLAERSGVSRAMVSKIERREVSPTAALLGRLCNGLGITLSSLIASAEANAAPAITRAVSQPTWRDPETGLLRTMVSPLHTDSRIEIVQIELPGGAEVRYEAQRHTQYDQQVWVQQGKLTLTLASADYELGPGDCMRSRVDVAHAFANRGRGACKYLVFISRG
jgi:transcriptional regulator with XRE-family HTH domain